MRWLVPVLVFIILVGFSHSENPLIYKHLNDSVELKGKWYSYLYLDSSDNFGATQIVSQNRSDDVWFFGDVKDKLLLAENKKLIIDRIEEIPNGIGCVSNLIYLGDEAVGDFLVDILDFLSSSKYGRIKGVEIKDETDFRFTCVRFLGDLMNYPGWFLMCLS